MTQICSKISIGVRANCAFLTLLFFLLTVSAFGYQQDGVIDNERAVDNSTSIGNMVIAASDGLSYGMTKKEAYDIKGVPDKTNRLADEVGKEMWVYRCQNDDGYDEDCLYLYFDGDELVKIERL